MSAPAGAVEGRADGPVHAYKDLPYAAPPVGAGRWKPPGPPPRWTGVRKAIDFGPACLQPTLPPGALYGDSPPRMSEDCLTLNVWTPSEAGKAPVLVWLHGGAMVTGSGGDPVYDGARLAREGVVVVTVNYRLGVLGWLAHPELSAESPDGVSGNYGLMDQVAALRWVRDNIAAFGGDPENVTIAGQSSGALNVVYLMASPTARGLFQRAIAQSGYLVAAPELKTPRYGLPSAEAFGAGLATKLHAPSIAALRGWDGKTLVNAAAMAGFAPFGVVDGKVLPRQPIEVFDRGEEAPVPVLAGFDSGEIRSLPFLAPKVPASAEAYQAAVHERYGDLADAFLKLYPATNLRESVLAATRDGLYGWTAEHLAARQTAIGKSAFLYLFDHGYPAADQAGLHAFHGAELPFMFGTIARLPSAWPHPPATPQEQALSDAMVAYWTSFARTGVPTAPGAPKWPAYGASGAAMLFQAGPEAFSGLFPGMYALHEATVCRRRQANLPWGWNVGLAAPPTQKSAGCP
ncbi:MAG TPA: carboxylesterase family protein [Caulobacteraceae bacterium]|nr:carboxylesterase family protein [Caulobacteraceae bacterium]